MSPRTQHPRCPRHGREVPPDTVCGPCRAEALEDGRERPWTDPRPRCPDHGLTLARTGLCAACAGDHRAGDHEDVPSPLCPVCTFQTAARTEVAAHVARWSPTDCLDTIPTTERTHPA